MNLVRFSFRWGLLAAASMVVLGCGEQQMEAIASAERARTAVASSALTQSQVLPTGPTCTPTGGHGKHGALANVTCKACHVCGGVLEFDPAGPAVAAGKPLPSFDATSKTCSNVACHSVPAGTYAYTSYDWDADQLNYNTVPYGSAGAETPAWNTSGGSTACTGCHGNPPQAPGGGFYAWHSGFHGGQGPTGPYNQCQFCHPDVVGTGGVATGFNTAACEFTDRITKKTVSVANCSTLHANGTLTIGPRFSSACFGCH